MAARKNLAHSETVRQRIRLSQLVNRLTNHALKNTPKHAMTSTQVAAALGLIRKVLPDIEAIEYLGEVKVKHSIVSDKPMTAEEWENRYSARATASPD